MELGLMYKGEFVPLEKVSSLSIFNHPREDRYFESKNNDALRTYFSFAVNDNEFIRYITDKDEIEGYNKLLKVFKEWTDEVNASYINKCKYNREVK